jgi:hypothetical protein
MKVKIGFTGTQAGMTSLQKERFTSSLLELLGSNEFAEFHHGDCIGADLNAHYIVRQHYTDTKIIIHPPIIPDKRALCEGDEYREEKEYLVRNHDIVDDTGFLIACPKGFKEERYSGTWATIRYARKLNKPIAIIWPDANVTVE